MGPFVEHGKVVRSATPAGAVASATHYGPYGGLGAAHDAVRRWCEANNHASRVQAGRSTVTGSKSGMPIRREFARTSTICCPMTPAYSAHHCGQRKIPSEVTGTHPSIHRATLPGETSPGATDGPGDAGHRLLLDLKNGDPAAVDRLMPIVYDELRRLAAHYLRDERAAATLQPTALVHEAYLRLVAQHMPDWESRSHFFGVAAHSCARSWSTMPVATAARSAAAVRCRRARRGRRLRADEIRRHRRARRCADRARRGRRAKAKVIELRFFGGLSVEETARALDVSVGTIGREQRMAKPGCIASCPAATMTPDRWQKIGDLFEQALAAAAGERPA